MRTSSKGRKCRQSRCKQVLSVYNHEAYCHVHLHQLPQEFRAKAEGLK